MPLLNISIWKVLELLESYSLTPCHVTAAPPGMVLQVTWPGSGLRSSKRAEMRGIQNWSVRVSQYSLSPRPKVT